MEEAISRRQWLPEDIIQLILSYLDVKEQARACVLSKAWLNAWLNKSTLEFHSLFFAKHPDNSSTHNVSKRARLEQVQEDPLDYIRRFKNYVSSTLGRCGDHIQEVNLSMILTSPADNLLIDRWLGIAVEKGLKVLRISLEKNRGSKLRYTLPENIIFPADEPSASSPLTELCLNYRCQFPRQVYELHAPARNNKLKKLSLNSTRLRPKFFSTLVNKFPNLEFLKVDGCFGFDRINLVSHSLKHIEIIHFFSNSKPRLEKVEIDTPSLTFLEIGFDELEFLPALSFVRNYVVLPKSQTPMVCRLYCLCQSSSVVDAAWFIKLKKMLSDLTPSRVSFHIMYPEPFCVSVMDDDPSSPLQVSAAAVDVEILKLTLDCGYSSINLVSCLLWACRPKTLVLRFRNFSDYAINYLLRLLSESRVALDRFSRSWQNDLREARLFNETQNKWQQLQQPSTYLTFTYPALSSIKEWTEIRIALDWNVPSKVGA